jgi:disulfide bond formation protein DsbB
MQITSRTMTARVALPKNVIAAALLLAAVGFIASLLIEHVGLLVPCELCLIQRWSVFAAVLFLGVALISTAGRLSVIGCAGAVLATLVSLAAAGRHVWLQTHPGEPLGCLPDFFGRGAAAATTAKPVSDLAALGSPLQALTSTPSACSAPQAVTLGFSLADWSLAYAAILASVVGLAIVLVVLANRRAAAANQKAE